MSDLNFDEKRIVKSITSIFYALSEINKIHDLQHNNYLTKDFLLEGIFMIRALVSGEDHEARKFFDSKRKRGRPASDPYSRRRIVLAEAVRIMLTKDGLSPPEARRKIEIALKGRFGAVTASQLESYFNKNDEYEAQQTVRELLIPILNKEHLLGNIISPIELMLDLWDEHGPNPGSR